MTSGSGRATFPIVSRKIVAIGLLFALAHPACSATTAITPSTGSFMATPSPAEASVARSAAPAASPEFDPALAAKLQTSLERVAKAMEYPALAVAVILADGSSWSGAAGMADVMAEMPASPGTSFAVGSITKTFTAALVLELAQDGVLSLDDPIAKWLPQLAGDARFAADRVTVRQLLDHTSGIAAPAGNDAFMAAVLKDPARRWTLDELLAYVGDPTFEPGTGWRYSNTGYMLAGMIIESATGSTVADVLRHRLLVPLGLERTVLQPQERPDSPTAHGYASYLPGRSLRTDLWDGSGLTPCASLASAAWTAGGLAATASDLARWGAALYGGRVLDQASLAEMLDFERNAGLPNGGSYGLGAMKGLVEGVEAVGHSGAVPGFQAEMWYLTKQRAVLVVFANSDTARVADAYQSLQRIVVEHIGA